MKHWIIRIVLFTSLGLLSLTPALAQEGEETEELPVIPYITTSGGVEQFNVPVPAGWRNIGTAQLPHLVTDAANADIYIVALEADDESSGQLAAIQQIVPDFTGDTARVTGQLNLDGNIWTQQVYDLADGQTLSVFSMLKDSVEYAMIFLAHGGESRLYLIATRPEPTSVDNGIQEALGQLFNGADAVGEPTATQTVTLSNGDWIRNEYGEVDGMPVTALGQLRGNTTFVVVQHGEGDAIDTINKAFYTVLFGFFITPDTASYLNMGLVVIFGLLALLIASMVVRYRNLKKDAQVIAELRAEGS